MRNLALRAADAARNTAVLIESTVSRVHHGSELVKKTGEALFQVSGTTSRVDGLLAEIAAASNEQAQGIDQVSKAVAEMDGIVQRNAAQAEESASASVALSGQAEETSHYVGELVVLVNGSNHAANGKKEQKLQQAGAGISRFLAHASNGGREKGRREVTVVATAGREAAAKP